MPLVTAASVASLLGVPASDPLLVSLVDAGNAAVTKACRRLFDSAEYTHVLRGYGTNFVFVRESPIVEVIEVRIDRAGKFGDETIVSDLTPFAFDPDPLNDDAHLYYTAGVFPEASRAVKVKYEAGFETPPADLAEALTNDIIAAHKNGANEWFANHSLGDDSFSRFAECISPRLTAAIRRYQR